MDSNYCLGIDYHKKFSYVVVIDGKGKTIKEGQVDNSFEAWQRFIGQVPGSKKAVFEAGRTWGVLYDWLEQLEIPTVVAHPKRVRAIAEASIKTDRLDAQVLAQLLRGDLIPAIHIPQRITRDQKQMLRYRLHLVKAQTRIKNRLHVLVDLHRVKLPPRTDLFGKSGRVFLGGLILAEPGQTLLEKQLALLDTLRLQIHQVDLWLKTHLQPRPEMEHLQSIPGFGLILGATVALEIDDIRRFSRPQKLASYAGLVPSTYRSSTFLAHGHTLRDCNHWLKAAFVEAAWSATRCSPYCQHVYADRRRKKPAGVAIMALANRLAHIVYAVLKERRCYEERPIIALAA